MSLQYVSDNSGNPTAIIIPIDEWNEITAKHEDLKELVPKQSKSVHKQKPSDFAGSISKDIANSILKDIEKSRDEWERNS